MPLLAVVADDHAIVRQGVKSILRLHPDIEVVGEAANGVELITLVKRYKPALAFADIAMPYASGLETVDEIKRWSPDSKLVILTGLTSRGLIAQAHAAPVDGVFLKSDPPEELFNAIPAILSGDRVYSTAIKAILDEATHADKLTARVTMTRDLLLTQRWLLRGRFEIEAAREADRRTGHASGLRRVDVGARLHYQVRRELMPYVGISFGRALGNSADLQRQEGAQAGEVRAVFGISAWF